MHIENGPLSWGVKRHLLLDAGLDSSRIIAGGRGRLRETAGVCVYERYQRVR